MKQFFYRIFLIWFFQMLSPQSCNLTAASQDNLVDITTINPTIIVDLRYATTNNFTKQKIYTSSICLVHKDTAVALDVVQKELAKAQLGLKIWDGYRPLEAQKKFWAICPDERYVCPPEKGGRHTRGTAVDVTLVDLKTQQELKMPTEFDDFSENAWITNNDISPEIKKNRDLLQTIMKKHGFEPVKTEWWHFDLIGWQNYPVIIK